MNAGRALLVASTGGHLEQITRLLPRFTPGWNSVEFATFDNAQSRSLLADEIVHWVATIPPRGLREAMEALGPAQRILREGNFDSVVSTGSAIAVPFLVAARALGLEAHYVESAARADGPSLSGRVLAKVPGVKLYTQYQSWADERWQYAGSVFDGFELATERATVGIPSRVVVTLGTMAGYPYRRAIASVRRLLHSMGAAEADVLWQVGDTTLDGLGVSGTTLIPSRDLTAAIRDADLVVGHAGIGTCLQILNMGRCPILLPRSRVFGEHIDDHQWLIANELERRGLAISRDPDALTQVDAGLAMSRRIDRLADSSSPGFTLSRDPVSVWS